MIERNGNRSQFGARDRVVSKLRRLVLLPGLCMPLVVLLGACNNFLDVTDPDIVQPEDLIDEAGLTTLWLGAIGDFAVAYSGSSSEPGQILKSGLFVDELKSTGFAARSQIDARRIPSAHMFMPNYYRNLHRARRAAEAAADAWSAADTVSGSSVALAELRSLAGYTYIFFAENYCSGVPFSRITDAGEFEYGEGTTTMEMLDEAIGYFDEALVNSEAATNIDLQHLAQIGKARALVNKAAFGEAGEIAATVPTDWEYTVKHTVSTGRQINGVVQFTNINERFSVSNEEGGGIDFRDAFEQGDPRSPWRVSPDSTAANSAFVGYHQLKYPFLDSPIVLASGIEGRLIEAEASLQAGDLSGFEQIHNELRMRLNSAAVGPIQVDTMSQDQMIDFHFRERALWLWLTGHRHGDLRRLVRQYNRSQEEAFPSGDYFKPDFATYGDQVVFPVPIEEMNNPNFSDGENLCVSLGA